MQVNNSPNIKPKITVESKSAGRWDAFKKLMVGIFRVLFAEKEKSELNFYAKVQEKDLKVQEKDLNVKSEDTGKLVLTTSNTLRNEAWLEQTEKAWTSALNKVDRKIAIPNLEQEKQRYRQAIKDKTPKQIHDITTKFYTHVLEKKYMKKLSKAQKQQFVQEVEMQMGMHIPKVIENSFKVGETSCVETLENIPFDHGISYLTALDSPEMDLKCHTVSQETQNYKAYVDYMKEHNSGGVRPSRLKKGKEAQGMGVNLRYHSVQVGDKKIHSLRSGAFTVNDKEIQGQKRTDLIIAQALPKVIKGIELMVSDPVKLEMAIKKGSFLYHEQSYMSDMDPSEKGMIQDVQNGMEALGKRFKVQFSNEGPFGISIQKQEDYDDVNGSGDLIIYTMKPPENVEVSKLGLTTIFTTHSVNEKQALGQFIGKKNTLQNEINTKAIEKLQKYNDNQPINEINDHYNTGKIAPIDYKGIDLFHKTVDDLGGMTGEMCKSGKDRTTCGFVRHVVNNSGLSAKDNKQLRVKLFSGASYVLTGQNTGKPPAYAFNSFQMGAGEHGYERGEFFPPKYLCGKVQS